MFEATFGAMYGLDLIAVKVLVTSLGDLDPVGPRFSYLFPIS